MLWSLKGWRRKRVLRRETLPVGLWEQVVRGLPLLHGFGAEELERLRQLSILFLAEKQLMGAAGLELTDEMRLTIAAQACVPILNLGPDYYEGWVSIIVYPEEFVPEHEYMDEAGVMHVTRHPLAGESWLQGPLILSWPDVERDRWEDGYNVVVHEFAHKLDMLDGVANGFPPLHPDMDAKAWTNAFAAAFDDLRHRAAEGLPTVVDSYAAEDPAEFFAVVSEAFFEIPADVQDAYPAVYAQLVAFYRQDPLRRRDPTHSRIEIHARG